MICPNCQSENQDGAKFCNDCGFPLTGRMAAVAAASTSDATLRSIAADDGPEDAQAGESDPDFEGTASAVEPESAGEPDASGPLDRSSIPAIDVAGVNVNENGNAFDFGSIGDDEAARAADDLTPFVPRRPDEEPISGRSEFLGLRRMPRRCGLRAPEEVVGPADTMEMPRIEGPGRAQAEGVPRTLMPTRGRAARARSWPYVLRYCLLAVGGAAAGVTY